MTKTLRVELADLEGIPHSSAPANTTVTVSARYTGPVILTDGTIIPAVPKSESMGSNGRVDFTVYTSDSPDVREDHHGFAVRVDAKVTEPSGRSYAYTRTVKPQEYQADVMRLGRMPSAEGLPPQWTTIEELVQKIEEGEFIVGPEGPQGPPGEQGDPGTTSWAGITDKPTNFAPSSHTHPWSEVTGAPAFLKSSDFVTWANAISQTVNGKANLEHTHDVLDVNGLESELQDKADAADVHDTGWVPVSLEDGWTGTARVRRTGPLVHFNVTDLVGPDSSTLATFAVIPEGFRAGPGFTAHGIGATSSPTAVGTVAMTATSSGGGPDMSQNVRVSTPSSWSGGAGNVWWHTDEPMPSSQDLAAMRGDGERGGPITHAAIVARSARWFPPAEPEQIPYSRQDTHDDGDGHEYRRDCSGFVSMALHADRSYSTRSIEEISTPIDKAELVPGDYLNSPDNHVVLFLGWTDETQTRYYARESSGPKGGTIERDVPYPYYSAVATYTPLRYVNVTD